MTFDRKVHEDFDLFDISNLRERHIS